MSKMEPEEFFAWLLSSAQSSCRKYGLPTSCLMAQGAIESSWGDAIIGEYNLFGRKWGGEGSYIVLPTKEWDTDRYITIDAKFQLYDSLEKACDDWCELMMWKSGDGSVDYLQYSLQYQKDHNLEDFVYGIASYYATEPSYAEDILNTIYANELEIFDV